MKKNIFLIQKNEKKMYLSYNIHYKLSNDTKIESFDDILITQICLKSAIFRYMQNGDLARKCD